MFRVIALAASMSILPGCGLVVMGLAGGTTGSGQAKTVTRKVDAFNRIEFNSAGDVEVKIGPETKVVLTADDNLEPLVKTTVSGGVLHVGNESNIRPKTKLRLVITTPNLDAFELNGAGDVSFDNVNTRTLDLEINGAGDVKGAGLADRLSVVVRGAGDVDFFELRAKAVDVSIQGAGSVRVHALDSLSGSINGAGDIRYRGAPKQVSTSRNGVGSITAD